jgi:sulfotransferase family protein
MPQAIPSAAVSASATAARPRAFAHAFLLATADSGAEEVLEALESTGRFRCVHERYLFWPGIDGFLRHYGTGPLPGIHQLTGFSQLVLAARRLSDNLASSAGLLAERDEQARLMPRVEYSPGNISGYPVLRLLYPDAVYVHIVRDPSFLIGCSRTASPSSAVRLGRRWRSEQRLLLGSPPAPAMVQARFEDILADPIVWAKSLGVLCGANLTDAELQRFAAVLRSRIAASGDASGRGWSVPAVGLLKRVLAWALAITCDAELAALGYQDSIGRPGACRRVAAAAILGSWGSSLRKGRP